MKVFYITICLLLPIFLFGQGAVSGKINHNTRWFGQIFVDGDITIQRGVNLTIEPGSRIILKANSDVTRSGKDPNKIEIIVLGTLSAFGAKGDGEIIFTSDARRPQPGDWHGIVVKNIREPSVISHCTIEYAYKGITCYGSSPAISDSEIRHNYYAGISCEIRSRAIIRDCFLIRNSFAGLICELGSTPLVERTTINENQNGVIIFDRSQPDLGRRSPKEGESSGENRIYDNIDVNVYNRSSNNIFAQNNNWNTTNVIEIQDKIVDKVDNPSHGTLIFQPVFRRRPAYVIAAAPQAIDTPAVTDSSGLLADSTGALPDSLLALSDSLYAASFAALQDRTLADSALLTVRSDSLQQIMARLTPGELDSAQFDVWKVAGFTAAGAGVAAASQNNGGSPSGNGQQPSTPQTTTGASQLTAENTVLERQVDRGKRHYIVRANPEYPSIYQQTGFEGRVIVSLIVGIDGKVEDYQIIRSNGELFSFAVAEALQEMRYEPETFQGQPTKFKLFESFSFQLSD